MTTIGLRELRQQASELPRRVEAGEEVAIAVAGRASARLVPAAPRAWRSWEEITELSHGSGGAAWSVDRDRIDAAMMTSLRRVSMRLSPGPSRPPGETRGGRTDQGHDVLEHVDA